MNPIQVQLRTPKSFVRVPKEYFANESSRNRSQVQTPNAQQNFAIVQQSRRTPSLQFVKVPQNQSFNLQNNNNRSRQPSLVKICSIKSDYSLNNVIYFKRNILLKLDSEKRFSKISLFNLIY